MLKKIVIAGLLILMGLNAAIVVWQAAEGLEEIGSGGQHTSAAADCNYKQYRLEETVVMEEFGYVFNIALAAPTTDLDRHIDQMRQMRQRVSGLVDADTCEEITRANTYLLNFVDFGIAGFTALANGESSAAANELFASGADWADEFLAYTAAWH
jgi:hypothetical protein